MFILNEKSNVLHLKRCSNIKRIKHNNVREFETVSNILKYEKDRNKEVNFCDNCKYILDSDNREENLLSKLIDERFRISFIKNYINTIKNYENEEISLNNEKFYFENKFRKERVNTHHKMIILTFNSLKCSLSKLKEKYNIEYIDDNELQTLTNIIKNKEDEINKFLKKEGVTNE